MKTNLISALRLALPWPVALSLFAACEPDSTSAEPVPPGWLCEETELDGLGDIKFVWRFAREADGVVLGERGVGTGVGVDMANERRFDEVGRAVYETWDFGADGTTDMLHEWTFDDEGLLRETLSDWLGPVRSAHEYDAAGHEVRRVITKEESGEQTALLFENDAHGLPLVTRTDEGADGSIENETRHLSEYDDRDRLVAYWYALTNDGQPFEGNEYQYDDDDRVVQQDWLSELDSPERYRFSYDELGRQVDKTLDYGPDGVVERRWTSTWCED